MKVIQRKDGAYAVLSENDEIIIQYGKYDWIDGFEKGLARVKLGHESNAIANNSNKWGIINMNGEEVLPVVYDNIWNFLGKKMFSTRVEKDGEVKHINFHDLNPELPKVAINREDHEPSDTPDLDNEEENYGTTFSKYSGTYAQDIAGFSDDIIDDVFEGDPEAYWNID